jgi:hypothetical protein
MIEEITKEHDAYKEVTATLHQRALDGLNINQYNLDIAYENYKRYLRALKRHAVEERKKRKELEK